MTSPPVQPSGAADAPRRRRAWRFGAPAFLASVALVALAGFAVALALPADRYLRFQQLDDTQQYRARWIYERIHFDPTPIDIAILGPSRTLYGVNAPLLEKALAARGYGGLHAANLSLPDPGFDLTKALAEEVVAYKHPKVVIVGATEQLSRRGHPAFKDLADVDDLVTAPVVGNRFYFENLVRAAYRQIQIAAIGLDPAFFGYDRGFDPARYARIPADTTFDERLPDGHVVDHTSIRTEAFLDADRAKFVRGIQPPLLHGRLFPVEFSISLDGYAGVARAAHSSGAQLYFLYQGYFKGPQQPQEQGFYQGLGPVIPANWGSGDYRLFSDSRHRNRPGAAVLTQGLADWLASRWRARGAPATNRSGDGHDA